MPTSHRYQLIDIIDLIYFTHPQRLLDIGIGFGQYGFLAREYLEIWDKTEQYDVWHCQIDGIEAFSEYIRPWHEQIYDNIFLGNARAIVPTLTTSYDLTLLIDVLEHFTYLAFGKKCSEAARKSAAIARGISYSDMHPGPYGSIANYIYTNDGGNCNKRAHAKFAIQQNRDSRR